MTARSSQFLLSVFLFRMKNWNINVASVKLRKLLFHTTSSGYQGQLPRLLHINFNYSFSYPDSKSGNFKIQITGHFRATERNEARVDLVLIQPFLLSYVNYVVVILRKQMKFCIKTWSSSASHSLES